jgi:hypothetical protein
MTGPRDFRTGSRGPQVVEPIPIQVLNQRLPRDVFEFALRLDGAGIVTLDVGTPEQTASLVAYVSRLGQWLGEHLGLDRFVAMECVLQSGSCFILREPDGHVLALKPKTPAVMMVLRELLEV